VYGSDRSGPDLALVPAAREGDQHALDTLVASCMPLIYNVVGRALDGHSDVDDVVQETLLRIVRGLPGLRDPGAFRSWSVAIAVRQIRDRERARTAAADRTAPLESIDQVADPASDFASLTVLRLGLTDQRREVAEATRWLVDADRALLALWWLECSGELTRPELAAALGLTERHTAVRVQRLREQIELCRSIVRALDGSSGHCRSLDSMRALWVGEPGPLWRKRFGRHIRSCEVCGAADTAKVPAERLLSGLPLLPLPAPAAPWSASSPVPGNEVDEPSAIVDLTEPGAGGRTGRAARRRAARRTTHRRRGVVVASAVAAVAAALLVAALLPSGDPAGHGAGTAGTAGVPVRDEPSAPVLPKRPSPPAASDTTSPPTPVATHARPPAAEPARGAPAPPPPGKTAVASDRKGVGVWTFPGVSGALADSGAGWYYTWATDHPGVTTPARAGFVPMIWGKDSADAANLGRARAAGPYLLGFNEPDRATQSNMTVEQALALWPSLEANGKILGSPAVAYGGDTAGGWLDRFMSGARERGYRVDFIALHWYGGDFRTEAAVGQLKSYVEAVHARYGKPVWLTEFALTDFSQGTRYPTDTQQAAFLSAASTMLAELPYVRRWAWFGLPASGSGPSTGLYRSGPAITPEGRAFRDAR
jgi:RNA polymerase sigma factor (sigma-70 family)